MRCAFLHRAVSVIGCAVLAASCSDSPEGGAPTDPSFGAGANSAFQFLDGNWTGTWTDTVYNVSGTLQASIDVVGSNVTATGTIGLQSLGFGLGNEAGTASGTISGNTLTFGFSAAAVGFGSGTLSSNGQGSGGGTVTGTLNFGAFTYTGTASGTTISGTFEFTSPTGGRGIAKLTKQ